MVLGSPGLVKLEKNESGWLNFLHSIKRRWSFALIILFITCFLVFSAFWSIGSGAFGIARSSFGDDVEQRILDDYLQDEVRRVKYKDFVYFSPSDFPSIGDVEKKISSIIQNNKGSYGVYSKNLNTGEEVLYRSGEQFTMASISKLFASVTEMSIYEEESDFSAIQKMMHASDNSAFSSMVSKLGARSIVRHIRSVGYDNIDFIKNESSPADVGGYLEKLDTGELIGQELKSQLFEYMKNTTVEDRLPAYLPDEATVYHKIGTWSGSYSDAGIVDIADNRYVIVIMTDGAIYDEAVIAMRDISRMVYEFWKINTK